MPDPSEPRATGQRPDRAVRRQTIGQTAPKCPALLCIDLQYLGTVEGHGLFENHRKLGVPEHQIRYYLDRVRDTVLPTVQRLQGHCRQQGIEVIHARVQSLTEDGRDRSPEHKRLGVHAPPGSDRATFLPEVEPVGDEIVISKTASGLFNATNIHYVLRNLGITDLYVVGVYTNECVGSAVRDGADFGYRMTLVEDGTAAISPVLHKATILTLKGRFARVIDAVQAARELEKVGNRQSRQRKELEA